MPGEDGRIRGCNSRFSVSLAFRLPFEALLFFLFLLLFSLLFHTSVKLTLTLMLDVLSSSQTRDAFEIGRAHV